MFDQLTRSKTVGSSYFEIKKKLRMKNEINNIVIANIDITATGPK